MSKTENAVAPFKKSESTFSGPLLLPNLQTLSILLGASDHQTLQLVLGPSVTRIEVKYLQTLHEQSQVCLQLIAAGAPFIRHATLLNHQSDPFRLTADLSIFQNLRTVHVTKLALVTWRTLASCPHLEQVVVADTSFNHADISSVFDNPAVFPNLQRLRIEDHDSPDYSCWLLDKAVIPSLQALTAGSLMRNEDILRQLVKGSHLIEELGIRLDNTWTAKAVDFFLSFPRLHQLTLSSDNGHLHISEDHVELLAQSLPNLQAFCIKGGKSPTFSGLKDIRLVALAHHCKALLELQVPVLLFNPSSAFSPGSRSPSLLPSRSVRRLRFEPLILSPDPDPSIRFVAFLFPYADQIYVPGFESEFRRYQAMASSTVKAVWFVSADQIDCLEETLNCKSCTFIDLDKPSEPRCPTSANHT